MKALIKLALVAMLTSSSAMADSPVQFELDCPGRTVTITTNSLRITSASRASEQRLNRALKTWQGGRYADCTVVPGSIIL